MKTQSLFWFQFPRVRGRGWNRGNYQGNNSNGNPGNVNVPVRPPEEEWDPEYTPKSRKYYLVSTEQWKVIDYVLIILISWTQSEQTHLDLHLQHDDRDGEKTWSDNRGRGRGAFPARRGRFVYRKGGGSSPKWTHDMYQGGEEMGDDSVEVEHKDTKGPGDPGLK